MTQYLINKICDRVFNCYGELSLPKSTRAYLDGASSEFHEIDIETKLYHMGYLLKRGYNLYADFKDDIDRHMQDAQYGGYEEEAKHALGTYITFLRSGENYNYMDSDYTFKELYDMLVAELHARYEETKDWQTGDDIYQIQNTRL